MNEDIFLEYITEAVADKLKAIASFRGYVTEKDICEIINQEAGTALEGREDVRYFLGDLID